MFFPNSKCVINSSVSNHSDNALSSIHNDLVRTRKECWIFDPTYLKFYNTIFTRINFIVYFVIPVTVFIVGGVLISVKLSRSMNKSGSKTDHSERKGHRNMSSQITLTVLVINATFIILVTPVLVFMQGLQKWVDPVNGMTPLQEVIWAIANQLFFINHAVNFLLYFMTGRQFRQQWFAIFTCKSQVGKSHSQGDSQVFTTF